MTAPVSGASAFPVGNSLPDEHTSETPLSQRKVLPVEASSTPDLCVPFSSCQRSFLTFLSARPFAPQGRFLVRPLCHPRETKS